MAASETIGGVPEHADTGPPRLLLVTRNYPPLLGGMERLNQKISGELARGYRVRVIAPRGSAAHVPPGLTHDEVPLSPLALFIFRAGVVSLRRAWRERPAVVLAGSGLTAPLAWLAARASGARAAAYVHGLDLAIRHPLYRLFWFPVLRRLDVVVANSHATAERARVLGIPPERIAIVPPGTDLPEPDPSARARFRARHGWAPTAFLLLFVGRLTERKGLRGFVTDVLPHVAAHRGDIVLAVAGEPPKSALHARRETPEDLLDAARAAGVGERLHFLGSLHGPDLDEAYAAADVHVFPVRDDPSDPEGFGMVAIEAAAHGVPTVAYATGGVRESVADGLSGRLVRAGDAPGFARAVLEILEHPLPAEHIRIHAARFAWSEIGTKLRTALDPTLATRPPGVPPPPLEHIGTVTVTYRPEPALLLRQLRALPSRCPKIVVDNTPRDGPESPLRPLLHDVPGVVLVEGATNRGLAAGLDLGVRILRATAGDVTHVLFLDQDSEPEPDLVVRLAQALSALEAAARRAGAVGPVLRDAASGRPHALHAPSRWRWRRVPPPGADAPPQPVATLNGSGTFMRVALYEELGGFDPDLFIDHVDTEWSFRLRARGYTLWCVPGAVLTHRMGRGSLPFWFFGWRIWPLRPPERHRTLFRNTLRLMRRGETPRVWKVWAGAKLVLTALAHGLADPVRGAQLRAMWRGFREGRRAPRSLPFRAEVIRDYERSQENPIAVTAHEAVEPDFGKTTNIPGWVWCRARDGRSGWTPASWLHRREGVWRLERTYDARELTVRRGEVLHLLLEESGFFWAIKSSGESGWVPDEVVAPATTGRDDPQIRRRASEGP